MQSRFVPLAGRAVFGLTAAMLIVGCTPIGAIIYKLTPETDTPASFTLKDVPTVVLVENYRNPDLAANDAELLARSLQSELEDHKVAVKLVKTEKILDLRNNRPKDFSTMTVPQIAKAVDAEQVIYVDLQSGGISSMTGDSMFTGEAGAAVKVIDAKTGATTFPADNSDGLPVGYKTSDLKGREVGSYAQVRSDLYEGLARNVGRLFHSWKASEDDDRDK